MSDGVNELLSAVGLMNEKAKDRSVAVQELADNQKQAAKDQDDALIRSAGDDKIVLQAKMIADQKAEQQTAALATQMGTNPDESTSIMGKLAEDWRTSSLNAIEKQNKLEHDMGINFFQHPGAFIKAQIGMEQTVKQADIATHHRDSAALALQQAQSLTQGAAVQSNALRKTVTDATMDATLDKVDATLQGQRAALKIQNSGIQMDALKALNGMDITEINNLQAGVSARLQQQQMALSAEHLKLAKQQAEQGRVEFEQRMADKKATKEEMQFYSDTISKGAATMGVDLTGLGSTKILSLFNNKAAGFSDYFNAGLHSAAGGTPTIADNAGEASRIVKERGAPLKTEQSEIKKLLTTAWDTASSPQGAQGLGIDPTKKDQVVGGAGKFANQKAAAMLKNIDMKDGTNIYSAPPLDAVMKTPGLQNTPWYNVVMKSQMQAGGLKEFNTEQLVGLTADAVKAGKISFNDAAVGLQGAHTAAIRLNNATKNYKGFGLPEQNSFNIQLPNALGFTRTYDVSTPQAIQQLLSNKLNTARNANQAGLANRPFD